MDKYPTIWVKKSRWVFLLLLFLGFSQAQGQESIQDSSIALGMLQVSYRGLVPGGDLADRFGYSSQLGMDFGWKFKNHFYVGGGAHAWFSEEIRDTSLLTNISTNGFLIGDEGLLTDIRTLGAGFVVPLTVGKQFALPFFPNPNSGFYVEVGGQFFFHKINLSAIDQDVSALQRDYAKGYDRLTYGLGVREEIGFRYFGNGGFVSLAIGLEFSQNFTRGRRTIHFDTGEPGTDKRLDLLSGIHVSWIFPIYERAPNQVYYR
jgi:hypothetical protein